MMRIAIDARELAGQATGVGRYIAEIVNGWDALPEAPSLDISLLAHVSLPPLSFRRLTVQTLVQPGRGGTWWEQTSLPRLIRRAAPDVFFAPAYSAPLTLSVPTVLTVHDVSFYAHPEWFSWLEGTRRRLFTRWSARRATSLLTVSQFSKAEIVRHLGVPPDRVRVVHSGPSGLLLTASGPAHATPREPLVLYVGSILARRHVPTLIDGFARLARRRNDVRLVIVGEARGTPSVDVAGPIRAAGLGDRVSHLGFADDATVAELYRRASAFAFLSEYEGFGLTPLDALQAGVPPVVLDTPVAREVYGAAAHYVSRADAQQVEHALELVLYDATERSRLTTAAPAALAQLSWAESARHTLDALKEAAR